MRTFKELRHLALMALMWWIQEWLEWNRRPRNLIKFVNGIGMWFKINGGRVVLDFRFSNITKLVFEGEIRKHV